MPSDAQERAALVERLDLTIDFIGPKGDCRGRIAPGRRGTMLAIRADTVAAIRALETLGREVEELTEALALACDLGEKAQQRERIAALEAELRHALLSTPGWSDRACALLAPATADTKKSEGSANKADIQDRRDYNASDVEAKAAAFDWLWDWLARKRPRLRRRLEWAISTYYHPGPATADDRETSEPNPSRRLTEEEAVEAGHLEPPDWHYDGDY